MEVFGSTRSTVRKDHALIAPDSFVRSDLPGWHNSQGVILISPQMGARFTQYLALMNPSARSGPPLPGIERMCFVLEGKLTLTFSRVPQATALEQGAYVYIPPDTPDVDLQAETTARLMIFEKTYVALPGGKSMSKLLHGQEQQVKGEPFLGDPDALLQTLLPVDPSFDMAVNIFNYRPGATLPMVEVHVMEHGLVMLAGQGVYRLSDCWYPVKRGDVIWMASYCPQWFVAMGKEPARYLYYKDVNRDPLQSFA
jgi:(S)-ureidoglycine aminohydrolase